MIFIQEYDQIIPQYSLNNENGTIMKSDVVETHFSASHIWKFWYRIQMKNVIFFYEKYDIIQNIFCLQNMDKFHSTKKIYVNAQLFVFLYFYSIKNCHDIYFKPISPKKACSSKKTINVDRSKHGKRWPSAELIEPWIMRNDRRKNEDLYIYLRGSTKI